MAAQAAAALLERGGTVVDAVQLAVEVLEDDPRFNAGTGSALTLTGEVECDAAIMEGSTLRAGAVCALKSFLHPVAVARAALEDGRHVLYAGSGAEGFARSVGIEPVHPGRLVTVAARERLARSIAAQEASAWTGGTVGAVARDRQGRVAAATSTGGTSGKRPGRVGDSPVLGAGTYADDRRGAVSATGHGEGILRVGLGLSVLGELAAGNDPEQAAKDALAAMEERVGARGGVILVTADGRLAWARSTAAMSWAAVCEGAAVDCGA